MAIQSYTSNIAALDNDNFNEQILPGTEETLLIDPTISMSDSLSFLRLQLKELSQFISSGKEELNSLMTEYEDRITNLTSQEQVDLKHISDLSKKIVKQQEAKKILKQQIKDLTKEVDKQKDAKELLEGQVQDLKKELDNQKAAKQQLEGRVQDLTKEIDKQKAAQAAIEQRSQQLIDQWNKYANSQKTVKERLDLKVNECKKQIVENAGEHSKAMIKKIDELRDTEIELINQRTAKEQLEQQVKEDKKLINGLLEYGANNLLNKVEKLISGPLFEHATIHDSQVALELIDLGLSANSPDSHLNASLYLEKIRAIWNLHRDRLGKIVMPDAKKKIIEAAQKGLEFCHDTPKYDKLKSEFYSRINDL